MLNAVAALGNRVSVLPRRLLGHLKPARAFIGQVEPTFDWTLKAPSAGQRLTSALCEAVYPVLYRQKPVGLALADWHGQVDGYDRIWTRWCGASTRARTWAKSSSSRGSRLGTSRAR